MSLKTKNGRIILCISVILIISIIINIFQIMIISEYRHRVGSITYNNIINVKNTNISNNDILLKSIETSTIEITDLLKLYKNYSFISNNIMSLWDEYNFYKNSNYIFTKKEIKTDVMVVNEIHNRIEEYLNVLIQKNINKKVDKIAINGIDLQNFIEMQELSSEIIDFYASFIKENMDGMDTNQRKDIITNEYYWIDILDNIDTITKEYNEFNIIK
ncbi:MAG: hypothetical protein SOZ71_08930 [Clostridium sp.]|nr:hypothetical protein [Clostridium sp.]